MFARAKRLNFNKIAIILLKKRKNIFKKFCSNEIVAIFASVKNKTSKQNGGSRSWKFKYDKTMRTRSATKLKDSEMI